MKKTDISFATFMNEIGWIFLVAPPVVLLILYLAVRLF